MHPKITPEHLGRGAVVYVRQSSMGQVAEHTESQRRQYALAEAARSLGFASVTVIDDDLGRPVPDWSSDPASRNWWPLSARLDRRGVLHQGVPPRSQRTRLAPPDRSMRARRHAGG
jgi:hypothetical protein